MRPLHGVTELGLTDEYQIQQVFLLRIDVREHSERLEGALFHILCFVDNQNDFLVFRIFVDQELDELVVHRDPAFISVFEAECHQYPLGEIAKRMVTEIDQTDSNLRLHVIDHAIDQGRFARPDLAGNHSETLLVENAVLQQCQSHTVVLRHVQERRIRQ